MLMLIQTLNDINFCILHQVVMPYSGAIPGGLKQGMEIEINGTVPHHCHQG